MNWASYTAIVGTDWTFVIIASKDEINQATMLIASIADQTNLLTLNSAIGAGREFAVVANLAVGLQSSVERFKI